MSSSGSPHARLGSRGPLPALLAEYQTWLFDAHPVLADLAGAEGYADRLGDYTAAGFEARERDVDAWLARFEAVDPTALGTEDAVDRDLVVSVLHGEQVAAGWPAWRRDPGTYLQPLFSALFGAFLHRLRPEPELVSSAVARLRVVPQVLEACRANLDPQLAAPLLVRRALGQARAGRDFLTAALPAEVTDERLRAELVAAAEPAAVAFDETVTFLEELAERATGDWRMGETRYSALLARRELLDLDATGLHQRGQAAYDELDGELRELAPRVPGGSTDWRATMTALQDDHPPTLEAMRAEYEAQTQRARAFLVEADLVPFADGETCRVMPAPVFQRAILSVAFYIAPPSLTPSRRGHFFVPFTPDGFTEEQVTQRLRTNARAQLPTVSVHETYPGHHWHLSWMAGLDRPVRKLHRSAYFAEGWALYAEKLLREHGYFAAPAHELAHLEARIFRAARIVVDTALHCGDMTIPQAEQYLTSRTALTPGTAAGEVTRYCAWPTQAPAYLTGALEIERLRAEYLAREGATLKGLHSRLAGSGCLPLGLARRALLETT